MEEAAGEVAAAPAGEAAAAATTGSKAAAVVAEKAMAAAGIKAVAVVAEKAMAVVVDEGFCTRTMSPLLLLGQDAVTTDAIAGTDQTDLCFWRKVLVVYNQFKPSGSVNRTPDQIRKKFGRFTTALRKFMVYTRTNCALLRVAATKPT